MDKLLNEILVFIEGAGILGPIVCCALIVVESILPMLPLAVFIAFNAVFFGHLLGFIVSWVFTIIGCVVSYYLFRDKLRPYYERKIANQKGVKKFMKGFQKLDFSKLVILIAIPFTPAFLINIMAGLINMNFKKFFYALVIGKVSIVIFWGYIGTSILDSFKDPKILIKVVAMLVLAYGASRIVSKKYNIE